MRLLVIITILVSFQLFASEKTDADYAVEDENLYLQYEDTYHFDTYTPDQEYEWIVLNDCPVDFPQEYLDY